MREALRDHPQVGDIRGEGMLCAINVSERETRRSSDPARKLVPQIAATMLAQGRVFARAMPEGDIPGFAPPLCLTREEADNAVAATHRVVVAVLG
jgi:L-2,4-diaminobutyrate transaminase